MDSINSAINQNLSILSNWVDSTPVPQVIDTMTYDIYESSNPFRQKFSKSIDNKVLKYTVATTTGVGAEIFSAFTNPYYLTHKVVQLPTMYQNVVDVYKKYSTQQN